MHQKLSLGIIIGFSLVVITSWIFLIVPDLKSNPEYFEINMEVRLFASFATNVGEPLPESTKPFLTTSKQYVLEQDGKILQIKIHVTTEDLSTGDIIFNSEQLHYVDRTTKKFIDYDAYFIFPSNTQKQSYDAYMLIANKTLKFDFERTEIVNGLESFVFLTNTVSDISGKTPLFPSETLLHHMQLEIWVEPKTGRIIGQETDWILNAVRDGQEILVGKGHGKTTDFSIAIQSENYKKQIKLFYLYDTIIPILLVIASVGMIMAVFVNQNLRTRTEELEHSKKEKWEIVGKLSANLAHDIRNPLTSIKNSSKIIMKDVHEPSLQNEFDRINRNIKRIVHQIEEVLGFVKDSPLNIQKTTFQQILNSAFISIDIPQNIEMKISKNDFEIECDKEKIEIVFINIILNAIQAIDQSSGKIVIRLFDENDKIKIEIENNGPSIPDDILPKVFESLFTTKFEGTGLGLSICENIVKRHDGVISVTSPPTIFRIELPKSQ